MGVVCGGEVLVDAVLGPHLVRCEVGNSGEGRLLVLKDEMSDVAGD